MGDGGGEKKKKRYEKKQVELKCNTHFGSEMEGKEVQGDKSFE